MGYPPRIQFPGALYHVTTRGVARQPIFRDQIDFEFMLHVITRAVPRFEWKLHTYCLMPNHLHFVLETPEPNLARGMQVVGATHAQAFNRRYRRVGHVFQGRYHSVVIKRQSHLLEVCRYVVLNPVRAGLCEHPGDWPWSSYRATAGMSSVPPFLTVDWLLEQFGREPARARQRFADFVADGTVAASLPGLLSRA